MIDDEHDTHLGCDSGDCGPGRRNRYYAGKRLRPAAFELEQTYLVERRRLLNRAIHGWGVVYGFDLRWQPTPQPAGNGQHAHEPAISVGEGLALDRAGRELLQVGGRVLRARDVYISAEDREWLRTNQAATEATQPPQSRQAGHAAGSSPETCWLLSVHYAERQEGPVRVKDDCSCDRAEWDYLCETVRYSVRRVDASCCNADHPCELGCRCTMPETCVPRADPLGRSSQQCMSRYLRRLDPDAEQIAMTEDGGQLRFDLANGIALARVGLRWNACGAPELTGVIDDWGPRRLVKRNDLLFDLIRGCDLTRISDISWRAWHRQRTEVKWRDFADYIDGASEKNFTVTFSGPVQSATVTVDCFAMIVLVADPSGWREPRRVPIFDVATSPPEDGDPPGSTRSATLVFEDEWVDDELGEKRRNSLFSRGPSEVEIEVRTDFILDACGQAVDGSPIGTQPAPTGNGSPGGCFLSTFRVARRLPQNGAN